MKLVFEQTGDELPFNGLNNEVLELFIDKIFVANSQYRRVSEYTIKLKNTINSVNHYLNSIGVDIVFPQVNTLHQTDLNYLHAFWAKNTEKKLKIKDHPALIEHYPDSKTHCTLYEIASKLQLGTLFQSLEDINILVHDIETIFTGNNFFQTEQITYSSVPWASQFSTNDFANISVPRHFTGRTLENKFRNFDDKLEFDDENNWNDMPTCLHINFGRPRTIEFSKEYKDWCKKLDLEPLGNQLNIGNFVNIHENLTTYRTIMYNNIQAGNSFSVRK